MVDTATAPLVVATSHDPVPAVAGQIRRYVRTLLHGWGVTADRIDDALLVVEELVANVLDHARTRFQLVVRRHGDVLHLAVRDHSTRPLELRPFDPHAARGRGLQLVSALALRWGCDEHADGKTVWVEL
jgi:anti-sigma regulatory factor (Ser/Thr protein kinase)